MICGAKWKTCDCPWFNTPPDANPFGGLPFPPPAQFMPRFRGRAAHQRNIGVALPILGGGLQAHGFGAEQAARRAQEQADEDLARLIAIEEAAAPDPTDVVFHREWRFGGVHVGANEAMTAAIQVLGIALGHAHALQPAVSQRHRPALPRRNATANAWTRQRRDRGEEPRAARRHDRQTRVPRAPDAPVRPGMGSTRRSSGMSVDAHSSISNDRERVRWRSELNDDHDANLLGRDRRRATMHGDFQAPSASAMAGLGVPGRRGRERVGGWLDHVAGGPNPFTA